jgi:hypothetical protein
VFLSTAAVEYLDPTVSDDLDVILLVVDECSPYARRRSCPFAELQWKREVAANGEPT